LNEPNAAEQFLKLDKGSLVVSTGQGHYVHAPEAPLPDEPFEIVSVLCSGVDLSDDELGMLAGCAGIKLLNLEGSPRLTVAGLRSLNPLPGLSEFFVGGTQVGGDGLTFIANYPRLSTLCLTVDRPEILLTMPDLPALRSFILSHGNPERIGDEGLKNIVKKCPGLQYLVVNDPNVNSLVPLAGLQELRRYGGSVSQFSDASIDTLTALPAFEELQVNDLDRQVLKRLQKLNGKLRRLAVNSNSAETTEFKTAADIAPVTQLEKIETLVIAQWITIDAATLHAVAKMPRLKSFVIISNRIPYDQRGTFRNFTADDIASFRESRPDVVLDVDGIE
jgi:hypothetical protein